MFDRIPWLSFHSLLSLERAETVLVTGISLNRLLILLTGIALLSVLLKSITLYLSDESRARTKIMQFPACILKCYVVQGREVH